MSYVKGQFHREQATKRAEKALDMAQRYEAGSTLQEIGTYYGITRERVRQLIKKELGMTGKDGGAAKRGRVRRAADAARRELSYMRKYGVSRAEYVRINQCLDPLGKKPILRFKEQSNNARTRGIAWELTFGEWWRIWEESGKWSVRGRGRGWCMARHGDRGPYAAWNVAIIHAPLNNGEYIRRYWSEVRSGKRQPPQQKRKGTSLPAIDPGQTITLPITQRRPVYAANYAWATAKQRGWKVRTSTKGGVLTVTRIA